MKARSILTAMLVLAFCAQSQTSRITKIVIDGKEAVAGSIIVKFKPQSNLSKTSQAASRAGLLQIYGATVRREWMTGSELWGVHPDETERVINGLKQNPLVEYAVPDYYCDKIAGATGQAPNDPYFGYQWHLNNTGQDGGAPGADIHALEAWNTTTGDSTLVVAVLDCGVDIDHPDLKANIWINKGEIPGNGIDDDGNGFVDDVNGWDFVNNSNDPRPRGNSHGTQCAGLIAAVQNNGIGVSGIAPRVKIMALRNLDSTGGGAVSNGLSALEYAIKNGAKITNHSYANIYVTYQPQLEMYALANQRGLLVVASAGNAAADLDQDAYIAPATLNYPNIISVANTERHDSLAASSCFGLNEVDVAAPGDGTYTTLTDGAYGGFSGTSASAPVATGVAALIWSAFPSLTAVQVKQQLVLSSDLVPALYGYSGSNGRVNAARAVKGLYITPVDLAARTLNFGVNKVNTAAAPQYLVVRNSGSTSVVVDSIVVGLGYSFSPSDPGVRYKSMVTIGPRDSVSVAIYFIPSSPTQYVSFATIYQTNSYGQGVQQRSFLRGAAEVAGTLITSASVSGRWTKQNSPYLVNRDIQVAGELTLEPGTQIVFGGHYALTCSDENRLIMRGSVTDSITLTCRDHTVGWNGIILDSSRAGNVVFQYVVFEYARPVKQVFPHDYYLTKNLGTVITSGLSSPTITNCRFSWNECLDGPAILIEQGQAVIENCVFSYNRYFCGALYVYRVAKATYNNLLIVNNTGDWGSMLQFGSGSYVVNNLTAYGNSANYGITIDDATDVTFHSSIAYGNASRYQLATMGQTGGKASTLTIDYSDFDTTGTHGWVFRNTPATGLHKVVWGDGNILADPKFVSTAAGDYRLQSGSPGIDKGAPSTTGLRLGPTDLIGNERIAQGRLDMGVYESASAFIALAPPPLLVSPTDNASPITVTPLLQWSLSPKAGSYRLQLATEASFTTGLVYDVSLPLDTTRTLGPLQNVSKYYWRVAAVNDAGTSDWSVARSFVTAAAPSVPVLASPVDLATNVATSPTLSWKSAAGALKYRLQLYYQGTQLPPNFVYVVDSTRADTSFTPGLLDSQRKYFWRVASVGDGGTVWSAVKSFTTGIGAPRVTTLTLPPFGATTVATSTVVRWGFPAGAMSFRVQVAKDSSFATIVFDDSSSTLGACAVTKLLAATKYYWRVCGKNASGVGPWSPMSSFTTASGTAVGVVPTQTGLDRPADGSKSTILPVRLFAFGTPTATFSHFQVSTDSLFTHPVTEDSMCIMTVFEAQGLKASTTYYWRARIRNDFGWGAFSMAWSFTMASSLTGVEQLMEEIPVEYSLSQNFPNPFNPSTTLRFSIPKSGIVTLKIYDLLGRELTTLIAQELSPGYYQAVWRANVPSGVYVYRIQAGDFVQSKKMLLLK